jgi:hypothetical protein
MSVKVYLKEKKKRKPFVIQWFYAFLLLIKSIMLTKKLYGRNDKRGRASHVYGET